MAMNSLRHHAHGTVDETKGGLFIDNSEASRFHEWEFRVGIRWKSTKPEDSGKTMSTMSESLRGDAALLAMDIGGDALMAFDGSGVKKLVDAVRANVFPQAGAEAKELYKSGHEISGVLSRQPH